MPKKIWIISDTHFNHQFMIDKWIRPEDYQQQLIDNWKVRVKDWDIVYHLGDVIFSRPSELWWILNELPGYKVLIRGNHDKNKPNWYLSQGFDEVHEEYFLTLDYPLRKIHLTHKPVLTDADINISWHLHDYKNNNTFWHHKEDAINLNEKSRIYSCELDLYRPTEIKTIVSKSHQSHIHIMKYWPHTKTISYKVKQFWLWFLKVTRAINKFWEIRIF